ncbi:hypothetical protein PV05_04022 [Exophiala xenobiotica]|uniref:Uncharacterized protein n=1 Tax=Exophiala xenobiotica TaxID=348802 RepID=A0A0D2EXZ7_9EURO|nr:uncharacterized protein PV05_04022 [Exophiala xenobiotica]KIW59580.1 hypothetical protein PV05_04022 [Exophiala xenobiotica]
MSGEESTHRISLVDNSRHPQSETNMSANEEKENVQPDSGQETGTQKKGGTFTPDVCEDTYEDDADGGAQAPGSQSQKRWETTLEGRSKTPFHLLGSTLARASRRLHNQLVASLIPQSAASCAWAKDLEISLVSALVTKEVAQPNNKRRNMRI